MVTHKEDLIHWHCLLKARYLDAIFIFTSLWMWVKAVLRVDCLINQLLTKIRVNRTKWPYGSQGPFWVKGYLDLGTLYLFGVLWEKCSNIGLWSHAAIAIMSYSASVAEGPSGHDQGCQSLIKGRCLIITLGCVMLLNSCTCPLHQGGHALGLLLLWRQLSGHKMYRLSYPSNVDMSIFYCN